MASIILDRWRKILKPIAKKPKSQKKGTAKAAKNPTPNKKRKKRASSDSDSDYGSNSPVVPEASIRRSMRRPTVKVLDAEDNDDAAESDIADDTPGSGRRSAPFMECPTAIIVDESAVQSTIPNFVCTSCREAVWYPMAWNTWRSSYSSTPPHEPCEWLYQVSPFMGLSILLSFACRTMSGNIVLFPSAGPVRPIAPRNASSTT